MNKEEKRFQAAVAAMQGLCANSSATIPAKSYAEAAVSFADALLAELDRTKPEPETPKETSDLQQDLQPQIQTMTTQALTVQQPQDEQTGILDGLTPEQAETVRAFAWAVKNQSVQGVEFLYLPDQWNPKNESHGFEYDENYRIAPEPETPKADADGWIPHRPGDPMPSVERVRFKCRDGSEETGKCQFLEWGKLHHAKAEITAWKPA